MKNFILIPSILEDGLLMEKSQKEREES